MNIIGCFLMYRGELVLLRRHLHKPRGGTWGLPAGKVEKNETFDDAMIRELYEETGCLVKPMEIDSLGEFVFGQESEEYRFIAYKVKLDEKPELKIEEDAHSEAIWITPQDCMKRRDLVPDLAELVRKVKSAL